MTCCEPHPAMKYSLHRRWPSTELIRTFRSLMTVYRSVIEYRLACGDEVEAAIRAGYKLICGWMRESAAGRAHSGRGSATLVCARASLASLMDELRRAHGGEWLQAVASLLGMMMHFSSGEDGPIVNQRRPQKHFSTYPNSPALAALVGDAAAEHLLNEPAPAVCRRAADAERYAERALNFRVLDPSMESGQLLLEVGVSCLSRALSDHAPGSASARRVARAVLEKLCRDCLWGVDRNELAAAATRTVFSLLGAEFGIDGLAPAHVTTADALKDLRLKKFPRFDCVVNNPPWGEALSIEERGRLRKTFVTLTHLADTYVAFTELAIGQLRPGGLFALILPSQVATTVNASRLRDFLAGTTYLDRMVLLPRSAFADATVRAVVLVGRARPAEPPKGCRVVTYPLVNRLDAVLRPRSRFVPASKLLNKGEGILSFLLRPRATPAAHILGCLELSEVAFVTGGVRVYRCGRGVPPQTAEVVRDKRFTFSQPTPGTCPAICGRDVHAFRVGEPKQFIKLGKWLAEVGKNESLRGVPRIFLRELCRRDGAMTAAAARDGFVPLHGVLTIVPNFIDIGVLACILNSTTAAEYVRHNTASFMKVDFQAITLGELRRMPIPHAAIKAEHRGKLGLASASKRAIALQRRLSAIAREHSRLASPDGARAQRLRAEADAAVAELYKLSESDKDA